MLTSSVVDGTDLIEAVVDGTVEADTIARLRQQLTDVAERHGGARVLVEVHRLDGVEPRALWEDVRSRGLLRILRRSAVVTGTAPLRTAAKGAFALLPVDGRVLADRADALAWLDS